MIKRCIPIFCVLATFMFSLIVTVITAEADTFTVTRIDDPEPDECTVDDCSLREAIIATNNNGGQDFINLTAGVYVLSSAGGALVIIGDLTIIGAGASVTIIDGNNSVQIFDIYYPSVVNISGVTIQNGRANHGGAILSDGILTIVDSTIKDNTGIYGGGGIFIFTQVGGPALSLFNCTVTGNRAEAQTFGGLVGGGGIWLASVGESMIVNSTISGNFSGESGGGIWTAGYLKIVNTTVTNNGAANIGGIYSSGFAGLTSLSNTIVANNTNEDCFGIHSQGYNLSSDYSCGFNQINDLQGIDPYIGPLQDNGGPTLTHALLPGSPAIDAANNESSPDEDQRGFPRYQDGDGDGYYTSDIGAVEFQPDLKMDVSIDIKPGSDPNCFNSDSHGFIPVAILGSDVFDATAVDPFTVSLDGAAVKVKGKSGTAGSLEDVNDDGFIDLVVQIIDDGVYDSGEAVVTLTGETFDGVLIQGIDDICIVP